MKKKTTIAVVALALVLCFAIGGTLAWLKDETASVTNTFTYGNIEITLVESKNLDLKMVPGNDIKKDPKVTVVKGSEACWLFVKVEESDNFDSFMTYAIADGWTLYNTGETGSDIDTVANDSYFIYRKVDASAGDQSFAVLAGDEVTVITSVTKEMFEELTESTLPKLTFTAYAVQSDNVTTVEAAWQIAQGKTDAAE